MAINRTEIAHAHFLEENGAAETTRPSSSTEVSFFRRLTCESAP